MAAAVKKGIKISAPTKKLRVRPVHPPTAEMVSSAIRSLEERSGSSLIAIKKYLTSNYKIDAETLAPYIKKYLKGAVTSGQLIQTKGKGASGSFKLPSKTFVKIAKAKKNVAEKNPKTRKSASAIAGALKVIVKKKSSAKFAKSTSAEAISTKQKAAKATKDPKAPEPKSATVQNTAAATSEKPAVDI